MSSPGRRALLYLCLLLLAAGAAQGTLAARAYRFGGQPDFVFTTAISAALLAPTAAAGGIIGLCGGLITAALAGQTVGSFLVSRTLPGFFAGWLASRLFRANALVVMFSVLAASLLADLLYLLIAPRFGARLWLLPALIGSAWNAALAVPITLLLRRLGWEQGGR